MRAKQEREGGREKRNRMDVTNVEVWREFYISGIIFNPLDKTLCIN